MMTIRVGGAIALDHGCGTFAPSASKAVSCVAVEITPEMVEAGAQLLIESGYLGAYDVPLDDALRQTVMELLTLAFTQRNKRLT